jgi:hypothetical protein
MKTATDGSKQTIVFVTGRTRAPFEGDQSVGHGGPVSMVNGTIADVVFEHGRCRPKTFARRYSALIAG